MRLKTYISSKNDFHIVRSECGRKDITARTLRANLLWFVLFLFFTALNLTGRDGISLFWSVSFCLLDARTSFAFHGIRYLIRCKHSLERGLPQKDRQMFLFKFLICPSRFSQTIWNVLVCILCIPESRVPVSLSFGRKSWKKATKIKECWPFGFSEEGCPLQVVPLYYS